MLMKKIFVFICLSISFGYGAYSYDNNMNSELSEIALANIEALANDGETGGNTVDCYSSSQYERGASYYDCGSCTRQFNSKGVGNMRQCIVR